MDGGCGFVTGGCIGRGVGCTPNGGGPGLVESTVGRIGSPGGSGETSDMGGICVVGRSVSVAKQCVVGFPSVPGGQVHTGRWSFTLQSALVPQ